MKKYWNHMPQSTHNDCGIACIYMILKYHGVDTEYTSLKTGLIDDYNGIGVNQIKKLFGEMNIATKVYKANYNNIYNYNLTINKSQLPCIAMIEKEEGYHYIVLYSIRKGKIVFSDPAKSMVDSIKSIDFMHKIKYLLCFDFSTIDIPKKKIYHNTKNNFIIKNLLSEKKSIVKIMFFSIFISIIGIWLSSQFGVLIDLLNIDFWSTFSLFLAGVVAIYFVSIIINSIVAYLKNRLVIKTLKRIEKKILNNIISNLLQQNYSNYKFIHSGEILARVNDCMSMSVVISQFLLNILPNILIFLFGLIVVVKIDMGLSLIMITIISISIVINVCTFKRVFNNNYEVMVDYAEYYRGLSEIINGIKDIKTTNSEDYFYSKASEQIGDYEEKKEINEEYVNSLSAGQGWAYSIANLITLVVGILYVYDSKISLGNLTLVITISGMLQQICLSIINFQFDLIGFLASYNRILQILQTNDVEGEGIKNKKYPKKIEEINLSNYGIKFGELILLKDLNITLKGENIIIYGPSGCGKSSLAKNIAGLEHKYFGEILFNNNVCLSNQNISTQQIAYLSNESVLFSGSVLENICLDKQVLMANLKQICEDCCILDFVLSSPDKFEYKMEANQSNISTGQKQRLALARAIIREPKILILDEALSNIDLETKKKIIKNLQKYDFMKIYIAHERIDIKNSRTYVFSNQDIAEV